MNTDQAEDPQRQRLRERLEAIFIRTEKAAPWHDEAARLRGLVNHEGYVPVRTKLAGEDLDFLAGARDELLRFSELGLRLLDLHQPRDAGASPATPRIRSCGAGAACGAGPARHFVRCRSRSGRARSRPFRSRPDGSARCVDQRQPDLEPAAGPVVDARRSRRRAPPRCPRAIARPSPAPPSRRRGPAPASPRNATSNTRGRSSSGMPPQPSLTDDARHAVVRAGPRPSTVPSDGVCLIALTTRLRQRPAQLAASASTGSRAVGLGRQPHALGPGQRLGARRARRHQVAERRPLAGDSRSAPAWIRDSSNRSSTMRGQPVDLQPDLARGSG